MARLIIQSAQGGSREILLKPGVNRLGRSPENDHQLDEPSVSRFHCEIHVDDHQSVIKDLGSSNGTFVDGKRVQEIALQDGQSLRLGAFAVRYSLDAGAAPVAAVVEPVPAPKPQPIRVTPAAVETPSPPAQEVEAPAAGPDDCTHHPGEPAKFICQKCCAQFCAACVKQLRAGMRIFYSCPVCSGTCVPLASHRQAVRDERASFFALVLGAFGYPLNPDGLMVMIAGALLFSLLDWASFFASYAFLIGWVALVILLVGSVGYLFAFMRNIIVTTTQGHDVPSWPETDTAMHAVVIPFFQFLTIWLVCLAPGVTAMIWISPIVGWSLLAFGVFCVPMALLTVSMVDSVAGLNPVIIFASIGKAPWAYLLACIVFLLLLALSTGVRSAAELIHNARFLSFLSRIPVHLASLYGLAVQMRIMGLFYRRYSERLAWFK